MTLRPPPASLLLQRPTFPLSRVEAEEGGLNEKEEKMGVQN